MIAWTPERVHSLISAFGGVSPMAEALGHKHVTTVRAWRTAGKIPEWREHQIEVAAASKGLKLPRWFQNGTNR